MKKIITSILTIVAMMIFMSIPVFAAKETTNGFTIANKGSSSLTIKVTNTITQESQTVQLKGNSKETVEYTFTEPDTIEYLVEAENSSKKEPSYTVAFFIESDADGNLTSSVIPRTNGSTEKPTELVFGTPDAVSPKTGDTQNSTLFLAISIGAIIIVAGIICFAMRKRKEQA